MLEWFHKLQKQFYHAHISLQKISMFCFTEQDLQSIKYMIKALEPFNEALQGLCRKDPSIYTVERIYEFTLSSLDDLETEIGQELKGAFKQRLENRRKHELSHLMEYLVNLMYILNRKISMGLKLERLKSKSLLHQLQKGPLSL